MATTKPKGTKRKRPIVGIARASQARAAVRRPEVLRLRMRGKGYPEIAETLGCSINQAWQDFQQALRELPADEKEVNAARKLECQRLDWLHEKLVDRAERGDEKAIDTILRIGKRRAELMALDAPKRIEATGADGEPLIPVAALQALLLEEDE